MQSIKGSELYDLVSKWVQYFKSNGIKKGDRVAGILPNNVTAIAAMLGATSIGAVWSSCSPDFGFQGIYERLEQIQPSCIISIDQYTYKGKLISMIERLNEIKGSLTSTSLWVIATNESTENWTALSEIESLTPKQIEFESCAFDDPLFILFSSGTTGQPKCIVHSVGGTLLQHLKEHQLHCDLNANDTLFYYTTCGWMMWNWMVSALASNVSLVVYDGAAIVSQTDSIWDIIEAYNVTVLGVVRHLLRPQKNETLMWPKNAKINHYDCCYQRDPHYSVIIMNIYTMRLIIQFRWAQYLGERTLFRVLHYAIH